MRVVVSVLNSIRYYPHLAKIRGKFCGLDLKLRRSKKRNRLQLLKATSVRNIPTLNDQREGLSLPLSLFPLFLSLPYSTKQCLHFATPFQTAKFEDADIQEILYVNCLN